MKFRTPCFVRVEDVVERRKLVEWLEGRIGYRYCVGCFNARSAIDSPLIPYVLVSTRAETGWVECSVLRPDMGIDCGINIKLFKVLAAMNDDNDLDQAFVDDDGNFAISNSAIAGIKSWEAVHFATPRKATAEEIIDHYKRINL